MSARDTGRRNDPAPPLVREDRLKAALKANMARRKAQARARAAAEHEADPAPPEKRG